MIRFCVFNIWFDRVVVDNVMVVVCYGLHRLAHLLMISKLCRLFRSIRLLLLLVGVMLLLLPITVKVENGLE